MCSFIIKVLVIEDNCNAVNEFLLVSIQTYFDKLRFNLTNQVLMYGNNVLSVSVGYQTIPN